MGRLKRVVVKRSRSGSLQSQINVTPLVDVVLVLLIILMMIAPLAMHGFDVDIPKAEPAAALAEPSPDPIVLAIDRTGCPAVEAPETAGLPADCQVRIGDELLPLPALAQRTAQLFAGREPDDRVLFLTAYEQLNYEVALRIIDAAKSGADGLRIGLVAPERPETTSR